MGWDGTAALCICCEFPSDDPTPWSFSIWILLPRAAPEVLWIHQEEPVIPCGNHNPCSEFLARPFPPGVPSAGHHTSIPREKSQNHGRIWVGNHPIPTPFPPSQAAPPMAPPTFHPFPFPHSLLGNGSNPAPAFQNLLQPSPGTIHGGIVDRGNPGWAGDLRDPGFLLDSSPGEFLIPPEGILREFRARILTSPSYKYFPSSLG